MNPEVVLLQAKTIEAKGFSVDTVISDASASVDDKVVKRDTISGYSGRKNKGESEESKGQFFHGVPESAFAKRVRRDVQNVK